MARRRLTAQEAAEVLGTSVDAVRSRIRRGSLDSEKGKDGRVFVWLDADQAGAESQAEDASSSSPLVEELRDRVRFLERELERKDAILLNMTEVMRALNPPPEAPGSPETATEQPGRVSPSRRSKGLRDAQSGPGGGGCSGVDGDGLGDRGCGRAQRVGGVGRVGFLDLQRLCPVEGQKTARRHGYVLGSPE